MLKLLVLIVILNLAGCKEFNIQPSPTPAPMPTLSPTPSENWAVHESMGISLKIKIPYGWETDNTEMGIVLSEHMGKPETGGILEGILVHIFVKQTDSFHFSSSENVNIAWQMLKKVINDPQYVGNALVSEPVAFDWDRHDAAYYLLNNRDGTLTLLLAMELGDDHHVVVAHISLPEDQADRLRPLLPDLLDSLTIDNTVVDVSALRDLPDPLVFPVEASPTP
jgi:hypothetical protein